MNKSTIVIGEYVELDSRIHALDARVKLIGTFLLALVLFSAQSPVAVLFSTAFVCYLFWLTRLPLKNVWLSLRFVALFLLVFALLQLVFVQQGTILFTIGPLSIREEGLIAAALFFWRTITTFVIATLMTSSTSPYLITSAVESLLKPLTFIRFPVRDFAMMMSISLRFIPILREELHLIQKAQQARGYLNGEQSVLRRIKLMIPLFVPLCIRALKRAEELGQAMEARGYRSQVERSVWKKKEWSSQDSVALAVCIAVVCLVLWL